MENFQRNRYWCKFDGCDKSFQRREHLARHLRTHSQSRYVCKVCQKEFTRSDSLQRHLGVHGEEFKPAPSGRSKRACCTCHACKIKCDGDEPCRRCRQKNIECKYDQPALEPNRRAKNKAPAPAPSIIGSRNAYHGPGPSSVSCGTAVAISGEEAMDFQRKFEERLSSAFNKGNGLIDWASVRIQNDSLGSAAHLNDSYGAPSSASENENWPALPESETSMHLELYFTHFHHRWPILHAPLFEAETAPPALLSCVVMVGAYIHRTRDSKELAMSLHTHLIEYIFPRLGNFTSEDSTYHSSTLCILQVSLLCIIFALYCGEEPTLSKAMTVRSMLISTLREMGFFKPETPVPYNKAGYFVPLRILKEGEKQMLATCLFKLDCYFNILRCQPEFLTPEELHFPLPCTFALWNADGLHVWEHRQSIEPQARNRSTICRMIREPGLESMSPTDGLMLVEDIQLGICAMHSRVWKLWEQTRARPENDIENEVSNAIVRDSLKRRLEAWKSWLLRIPIPQTSHTDFSQEQHLAMRYYYGTEDHSQPGWQLTVFDRAKSLIFDTLMLYHLLGMSLHADVRTLTQLAKDKQILVSGFVPSDKYFKAAQEEREDSTRRWVESPHARRALCHAADTFFTFNNLPGLANNTVDPIAYISLSIAALVIWTYCILNGKGCTKCVAQGQVLSLVGVPTIELTKWSDPKTSRVFENEKETWIQLGDCRGAVAGALLCSCNIDLLPTRFRPCVRDGWDVCSTIAPGVFKSDSQTSSFSSSQ